MLAYQWCRWELCAWLRRWGEHKWRAMPQQQRYSGHNHNHCYELLRIFMANEVTAFRLCCKYLFKRARTILVFLEILDCRAGLSIDCTSTEHQICQPTVRASKDSRPPLETSQRDTFMVVSSFILSLSMGSSLIIWITSKNHGYKFEHVLTEGHLSRGLGFELSGRWQFCVSCSHDTRPIKSNTLGLDTGRLSYYTPKKRGGHGFTPQVQLLKQCQYRSS